MGVGAMTELGEVIAKIQEEGGKAAFTMRGGSTFDGRVEAVGENLLTIRSTSRFGDVGRHYLALGEVVAISVLVEEGDTPQ